MHRQNTINIQYYIKKQTIRVGYYCLMTHQFVFQKRILHVHVSHVNFNLFQPVLKELQPSSKNENIKITKNSNDV